MKNSTIPLTAALFALATPVAEAAPKVTAELFPHTVGALAEIKARVTEEETGISYFVRERLQQNYDGIHNQFVLNDLAVPVLADVRIAGQARIIGAALVPGVGVDRMNVFGDLSLYTDLKFLFTDPRTTEIHLVATYILGRGIVEVENATGIGALGLHYSKNRVHVGYRVLDDIAFGLAGEMDVTQGKPTAYPLGMFVRMGR